MDSDDEWITEKEDPVLPRDSSWMDVHECFQVVDQVESSQRKRKRGPRDLRAMRLGQGKGKKKVDELLDEEEEEEVEVDEDGEAQEEEMEDQDRRSSEIQEGSDDGFPWR